jgi:hypothetical protein
VENKKLLVIEKPSIQSHLLLLNQEYSVILRGSQVLIMRHWIGEDGNSKLIFLNRRDFLLLQENNKLYSDEGKPLKIGQLWLEWEKRSSYEEIYFEPQGKKYERRYNLWRGFGVDPNPKGKFDIFLDHIKTNICQGNEEYFEWVIAWLSDMFQKPARKPGTALVLRGGMGVGKGVFANHVGKLLGIHFIPITQASQLTGKFNGHMSDKLLMFVDEGWWSDERNGAGIFRALITETHVTIEMKGRDAVTIPNFTRFIIAANADWVVPVGMGDERRFSMLDVGNASQQNFNYFNEMQQQMNDGGYEAFLYYLLNYQYDESLPRKIISTAVLQEQKIYSMPNEMKWWHECLARAKIDDFKLGEDQGNNYISTDVFYTKYQDWCHKMRYQPLASNILPKKLKCLIDFNKKEKLTLTSIRDQCYFLATLTDLRDKFESFFGHKIDWNEF